MSDTLTPRLQVEGLRIRRKRRIVLDGFDFSHGPGRLAWVTGVNGAGKSSLLRVLAGRLRPSAGRVALGPDAASVAYYHPGMALPGDPRVGDWLRLVCSPDAVARTLVPPVAPGGLITRLSTGERKRLLLAGILSRTTAFTFLDEPYEHLSPDAKAALTRLLLDRARNGVVVVATNQEVPTEGGALVLRVDGDAGHETGAVEDRS